MSDLGTSVVQALGFLRGFFGDVSKLVTVVEGEMNGTGLASPWAAGSMWGASTSYAYPSRWLPKYVARQYVIAPSEGAKASGLAGWYAFFVVHFAPHPLGEPLAVWGTGILNTEQNVWTSLGGLVLTERGPKFITQLPVDEWQVLPEPGYDLAEFRYRAMAVVELCDETMVQQVVVAPLVAEVERIRAGKTAVQP